jgi:hypothetical protein
MQWESASVSLAEPLQRRDKMVLSDSTHLAHSGIRVSDGVRHHTLPGLAVAISASVWGQNPFGHGVPSPTMISENA